MPTPLIHPKIRSVQDLSPLVSVILPVYQGEDFVLNAVYSVLNQTYPYLELIVVDDGSQDKTPALLQSVQDERMVILQQPNQGAATARNVGLSKAKGQYIGFIDADDVWFPDKLSTEMDTLKQANYPIGFTYSWYYAVDEKNRLVNLSPPYQMAGNIFEHVLTKESVLLPSTTLFHRQVFDILGGFPTHRFHEDRTFVIKAAKFFRAYPTKQRLVIYRQSILGKCRGVLSHYDLALNAEQSILNALKDTLSPHEVRLLETIETRNLFYRFLMYNFMPSAKKLYRQIDHRLLKGDKKGHLARLSMVTGINFLFYTRLAVQSVTKYLLLPWWRIKSAPVYPH